jgi:formamidopyrimidine-DNA glycosylase
MPELPEVETVVRDLNQCGLIHATIKAARVNWARTIAEPSARAFSIRINGQKIVSITRRGKYIVIRLSKDTLLIHLRMTGRFVIADPHEPHSPYERVVLVLSTGKQLRYVDTRKFGRWFLMENPELHLNKLGIEPLGPEFTPSALKAILSKRSRSLKPLLLDQAVFAGIGNIYADEALWEAKLHPLARSDRLSDSEMRALYQAIPKVLRQGVELQGTTLGRGKLNFYRLDGTQGKHQSFLKAYRRTGEACPRCGTAIERIVVAQRSTHLCPKCQRLPT